MRTQYKNIPEKVKKEVKNDYLASGDSCRELSERHDVKPYHISKIIDECLKTLTEKQRTL